MRSARKIGQLACFVGSQTACEIVDTFDDFVEGALSSVADFFGVGATANKADIRVFKSVVTELGLNPEQAQMLHDEMKDMKAAGELLDRKEIRAMAEDIKRWHPKGGRGR